MRQGAIQYYLANEVHVKQVTAINFVSFLFGAEAFLTSPRTPLVSTSITPGQRDLVKSLFQRQLLLYTGYIVPFVHRMCGFSFVLSLQKLILTKMERNEFSLNKVLL